MSLSKRLARRFVASYFNVGDLILYGKYKNKKGRILEFGHDPKGNPTITIEPIPKGRKQNKLIGLFKIWKAPIDKQGHTMTDSKKVVARFVQAYGLEMGRKFEIGSVRFHRFADHFKVWDLTNAGKRGKKVQVMIITPPNMGGAEKSAWMDRMGQAIVDHDSYEEVKRFLKDLDSDRPGEIGIRETTERGVDVNPGGTTPIQIETNTGLIVSADPLKFTVLKRTDHVGPKGNKFKMDTNYFPVGRQDAAPFYNWLKANLSEANKLDIEGFQKIWDDLGVRWDSH